jgi:hypothetical protein
VGFAQPTLLGCALAHKELDFELTARRNATILACSRTDKRITLRTEMGLLKDIYDIIVAEPAAKRALSQGLAKILQGPGFWPGKKPSIQEQVDDLRLLVAKLSDDSFPRTFASILDYLSIIMATIVHITHLKKRGCFIKNFYSDRFNFYFPCPANEPKLRKEVYKGAPGRFLQLKNFANGNPNFYEFVALEKNAGTPSPDQMQEILEKIARTGGGGQVDFLEELRKSYSRVLSIVGIKESVNGQGFEFLSVNYNGTDLALSFDRREEIRSSIAADLKVILDFNLV